MSSPWTRKSSQFKAPFNQINNEHRVSTPEDTAIITPNSDTPYSMLWMDLRAEPLVVSVPAVDKKRYYSVQLIDGNTYNFGYIGSRATGNEAGDYMIAGPDWKGETPAGIKKVFTLDDAVLPRRSSARSCSVPADMPNVEKVQAGYKVAAAVRLPEAAGAAGRAEDRFLPAITEGIKTNFFDYLDFALQFVPPSAGGQGDSRASSPASASGRARPSTSRTSRWSTRPQSRSGMKEGDDKVDKYLAERAQERQRLDVSSVFGDRAFFNGNWLMRAAAAKGGLYGNDAVEAMYPYDPDRRTGSRSTPASTTTRSPSPPGSSRR